MNKKYHGSFQEEWFTELHTFLWVRKPSGVAPCMALEDGDLITSTHRGHSQVIGKGVDLNKMMAELLGKATGYCKGKGGSMHIADIDSGNLGANGVVGGGHGLSGRCCINTANEKTGKKLYFAFLGMVLARRQFS